MDSLEGTIFISYSSPDRERVRPIADDLERRGFTVWMDTKRLLPGQRWNHEIQEALDCAACVVVMLSNNSVDRRGYAQREINTTLDRLSEKLANDIYLVPVLLDDDVILPRQLAGVHYTKASDPDFLENISKSLRLQLGRLNIPVQNISSQSEIRFSYTRFEEKWEALPGYEVDIAFINLSSDTYPNVSEASDIIRASFIDRIHFYRKSKFNSPSGLMNFVQDRYARTDTFSASCSDPVIVGKILTIGYRVSWYGAGAAHPNHHQETYAFLLDPVVRILKLEDVFLEQRAPAALEILQAMSRASLSEQISLALSDDVHGTLNREWLESGTDNWDKFNQFVFEQDAIRLIFSPYQVAAYAFGMLSVEVHYKHFATLMRSEFQAALRLPRYNWPLEDVSRFYAER